MYVCICVRWREWGREGRREEGGGEEREKRRGKERESCQALSLIIHSGFFSTLTSLPAQWRILGLTSNNCVVWGALFDQYTKRGRRIESRHFYCPSPRLWGLSSGEWEAVLVGGSEIKRAFGLQRRRRRVGRGKVMARLAALPWRSMVFTISPLVLPCGEVSRAIAFAPLR